MRGKVVVFLCFNRYSGITPAYAGKSGVYPEHFYKRQDHPRVCGEKSGYSWLRAWVRGSPPRMRGKGSGFSCRSCRSGITPAYAGKSVLPWVLHKRPGDHPRVCGEKALLGVVNVFTEGSPPRMRGKGVQRDCPLVGMGITPAYAGKRLRTFGPYGCPKDHPRVCGEKGRRTPQTAAAWGSPPRMRGKD